MVNVQKTIGYVKTGMINYLPSSKSNAIMESNGFTNELWTIK